MAEGPLAFLRGVCDAALGKSDEARAQFQTYLTLVPNASIDASMYPKKAVVAFEDARKSLASGGKPAPAEMSSLATSYAKFRGTTPAAPENLNEAWGNGPVRFLMTAEEKTEWSRLSDPVSRSEFVTKFWTSRDLRPETPDNEFRQEFERRVAFADANFSQDEVRGSVTDRGMVFVLVGPPTWVGRKPIRTGEDSADAAGMSTSTRNDVTNRGRRCGAQPGGNRGSHDGPGHPNPGTRPRTGGKSGTTGASCCRRRSRTTRWISTSSRARDTERTSCSETRSPSPPSKPPDARRREAVLPDPNAQRSTLNAQPFLATPRSSLSGDTTSSDGIAARASPGRSTPSRTPCTRCGTTPR